MKQPGEVLDLAFEVKVIRGAGAEVDVVPFAELVRGPTVVSVYMRNRTGTCDRQNADLVAQAAAIRACGYALVAVSRDSIRSHQRYAAELGIDYVLVSDPGEQFARAVDARVEKQLYGRTFVGALRSAWILDERAGVRAVIDRVVAETHGAQVLAAIADLRATGGRR